MIEILYALLMVALVGFVVWLILNFVPMPEIFKTVIPVVVAVLVILWVLAWMSGNAALPSPPRFR